MLLVIEGCDGSGKTTFVGELMKLLTTAEVLHFGPPKQWPLAEYELALQDYVPGCGRHVICDRLHLGEIIYGPIYRGKCQLTGPDLVHLDAFLMSKGAVMIYLDAPDGELMARVSSRGDDFIDLKHLPSIAFQYRQLMRTERLPYLPNPSSRMAIAAGGAAEQRALATSSFTSYVGANAPHVLLVGDKKSDMAGEHTKAFVPWPGRSGEFLMRAVERLGVPWGVLNQADDNVADAYHILDQPRVVALGAEALKACDHAQVPCGSVPHPAYAVRWGLDFTKYVVALKFAATQQHYTAEMVRVL